MRVFVVAAVHGDEPFGIKIINKLQHAANSDLVTKIGHPEALARGQRFIDEDLNRSFNLKRQSIEANIARDIKKEISEHKADIILDIHTSISDVGKVAIVAEYHPLTASIARQLGMEAIVIMPRKLVDRSLIGCFPEKSISLEFGKTQRADKLAADIASRIEALKLEQQNPGKLPVFEVYAQIDKNFKRLAGIKNLVFNKELNAYPFLAGVGTYETMGGFIARKIK